MLENAMRLIEIFEKFLIEDAADDILNPLIKNGIDVSKYLEFGKIVLKKLDRKQWFYALVRHHYSNIPKTKYQFDGNDLQYNIDDLMIKLKHFFDLNIDKINTIFKLDTHVEPLLQTFTQIETEKQEQNKSYEKTLIHHNNSYKDKKYTPEQLLPIIKIKNKDFAWFKMPVGGCSVEANSMGHCGNGTGQPGQNLLSFREHISGETWRPYLTFILEKDGFLGEMKARNNQRPADYLHPGIIQLLKSGNIKGLRGGGYMPENNFNIFQLSDEDIEKVSEFTPQFYKDIISGSILKI